MSLLSSSSDLSGATVSPVPLPVVIVGDTGQRVFPELDNLIGIVGKFIGEIAHTYNATWEWTGFVWRQRF